MTCSNHQKSFSQTSNLEVRKNKRRLQTDNKRCEQQIFDNRYGKNIHLKKRIREKERFKSMYAKKECVAMLLAGGQGSRLYTLTDHTAKPAVPFGGKYRIIDFPLSNCVNSGIDTVGVLTQYQPLMLNEYIGSGKPWDLDRMNGGV